MQKIEQGMVGKFAGLRALVALSGFFIFGLVLALPTRAATDSSTKNGSIFTDENISGLSTDNFIWSNPNNASTSDNVYATVNLTNSGQQTHYLKVQGFNFNIPADATIDGIKVEIERKQACSDHQGCTTSDVEDYIVKVLKSGSVIGSNKASDTDWPISDTVKTYGSSTDKWTTTPWTVSDINSSSFGVVLSAERDQGGDRLLSVDSITITVYYTLTDTTAPTLSQITAVPTPTNDTTPNYTFNSSEAGTIIYGGDCSSATTVAVVGNNTITFNALSTGAHSDCTIKVKDASNNTSTALSVNTFTVDTTGPVISAHDPITVNVEAAGPSTTVNYDLPTATDDSSFVVSCSPASGTLFVLGLTPVLCTATDLAGNSSTTTFNVFIQDTTGPVIASHLDVVAEATDATGANVSYTSPNATDAVSGTSAATCLPASGNLFAIGTTTITCDAVDGAGNSAVSTTFNVIVKDTTAPVITLISGNIDLVVGAVYTEHGATATDSVDGSLTELIVIGGFVNTSSPGVYSVTYNVSDSRGNAAEQVTRVVTVSDITAPIINTISNITAEATSSLGVIVEYGEVTATDDIDGVVSTTCNPISGSVFPLGSTAVTCTGVDLAGNDGNGVALTVTVQDTTAPVVVVTPSLGTFEATSTLGTEAFYTVSATDEVDGDLSGFVVCSPLSGSVFPLGDTTVTCTVTDSNENTGTGTAVIKVRDTVAPVVTAPANQTFEATGNLTTPTLVLATATDAVDASPVISFTPSSFPLGTTVVTWTAIDASGNVSSGEGNTSLVTITDTTAPVITLNGDETMNLTVGDVYTEQGATVIDNYCSEISVQIGGDVVNTTVAGTYHVTYNAHDCTSSEEEYYLSAIQKVRTVVVNSLPVIGGGSSGGGNAFVPPTPPSFGDRPITVGGGLGNTSTITLTFDVINASWIAISESPDFTGVSWIPYTTNTTFTLSAGNIEHKLYIKFRRVNGGETKVQEVTVLLNSPSTLIQAVLGVKVTRLNELVAKLKLGDRGSEVVELQTLLKQAGYFPANQVATGYFGPITQAAVNKYLSSNQAVLGVKIARVDELVAKLKLGDRGSEVVELQTLLKQAGYFPVYQTATGYYGPITSAAVKKYLAATK